MKNRTVSFTADEVRYQFEFSGAARSYTNHRLDFFEGHVREALIKVLRCNGVPITLISRRVLDFVSGGSNDLGQIVLGENVRLRSRPYEFRIPFNERGTIYTLEWTE